MLLGTRTGSSNRARSRPIRGGDGAIRGNRGRVAPGRGGAVPAVFSGPLNHFLWSINRGRFALVLRG